MKTEIDTHRDEELRALTVHDLGPSESASFADLEERFKHALPAEVALGGAVPEVVHGPDDRQVVSDTRRMPYKAIAKLYIEAADGSQWIGTGYLVGRDRLYTAGHCVFLHNRGGWAKSIVVVPAMNGASRPFGIHRTSALIATNGWIRQRSARYDMGGIKLPQPVSGSQWLTPQTGDVSRAEVVGYPGDREGGAKQLTHNGPVSQRQGQYRYLIDTAGGQSGGPVLASATRAVAIHNKGGTSNLGSDLYPEFIKAIASW